MTEAPRPPWDGEPGRHGPDPTSGPPQYPSHDPNAQPGYPPPQQPYGSQQPYGTPQQPYGAPQQPYGAYQQPGYGAGPPQGYATNEEKTWVLVAHFGGALGAFLGAGGGGWIAPLVALLAKGNESPTVRAHAVAALNFQITATIAAIIGWTVGCVLLFIPGFVVMILAVVFGIIGGVKANDGQFYKYPLSLNLVK